MTEEAAWEVERDRYGVMCHPELEVGECIKVVPQDALREVYDYMCEVEGALVGHIAVRNYLSLPRTEDERKAIGERARRLLGITDASLSPADERRQGLWEDYRRERDTEEERDD